MLRNKNSSENNRTKREGREHHAHDHTHVDLDPVILTTQRGIWAIKWSFLGLFITALLQVIVVLFSGSVALLADTIHNFGDAATSVPLWIAFAMARWKPSQKFTYGYGRVEDLAGVTIVLIILFSAVITGYKSINRLFHPQNIEYLWAVATASVVGFLGNELVAMLRIKVGKEIGSAALIADGYHARVDGLTSLAVLLGATGVWFGYPLADPIVGLIISVAILRICWVSIKAVFSRFLDAVDHKVIHEITHTAKHTAGVHEVTEVRARWVGHRMHAEVNVAVSPEISVEEGHEIAKEVRHQLLHFLPHLSNATIHIDPANAVGEKYHRIAEHMHDELPPHSH